MRYAKLSLGLLLIGCTSCEEGASPPAWGVYQVYGLAAQTQGTAIQNMGLAGLARIPTKLSLFRTALAGPGRVPDFANGQLPPVCIGFEITPEKPPGLGAPDAGQLAFSGLNPVPLVDANTGTIAVAQTPDPVECNRIQPEGLDDSLYTCAPAPLLGVVAAGDLIDDNTQMSFRVAGSDIIGAVDAGPIAAPPSLQPTESFDAFMRDFDPKTEVVAEWIPNDADLAVVEIIARLNDNSRVAQILCLEPMQNGRVTIPAAAMSFVPEAESPFNPLIIITSVLAVNTARDDRAGWGGYLSGLGRGTTHMACRGPGNASCSPP